MGEKRMSPSEDMSCKQDTNCTNYTFTSYIRCEDLGSHLIFDTFALMVHLLLILGHQTIYMTKFMPYLSGGLTMSSQKFCSIRHVLYKSCYNKKQTLGLYHLYEQFGGVLFKMGLTYNVSYFLKNKHPLFLISKYCTFAQLVRTVVTNCSLNPCY